MKKNRNCLNCGWVSPHSKLYFCVCADCWRPAIIAAIASGVITWFLR